MKNKIARAFLYCNQYSLLIKPYLIVNPFGWYFKPWGFFENVRYNTRIGNLHLIVKFLFLSFAIEIYYPSKSKKVDPLDKITTGWESEEDSDHDL